VRLADAREPRKNVPCLDDYLLTFRKKGGVGHEGAWLNDHLVVKVKRITTRTWDGTWEEGRHPSREYHFGVPVIERRPSFDQGALLMGFVGEPLFFVREDERIRPVEMESEDCISVVVKKVFYYHLRTNPHETFFPEVADDNVDFALSNICGKHHHRKGLIIPGGLIVTREISSTKIGILAITHDVWNLPREKQGLSFCSECRPFRKEHR
jgi:hypothetical protein